MVDFKKLVTKVEKNKKTHPCDIYETLDRASDKGPLRPVQDDILEIWHKEFSGERDVILKLHTGQGKTLIGLLILQSRINQGKGAAVYLCPNNYLIEQTCQQAESFGIPYTTFEKGGFEDFSEGKIILITSVSKLFNGESKFGLNQNSLSVATLLLDDSHACIDIIKNACKIVLSQGSDPYNELLNLFGTEIEKQGVGTYADILNQYYNSFLPVPYWDWQDKQSDVARILSKHKDLDEIRFVWPLIKDDLRDCFCVISGKSLEIAPHIVPLDKFGSYYNAEHRIFMSATLIDDSFFIKGLGLDSKTIKKPLSVKGEKWSGERMILIPSLIEESLDREEIVSKFGAQKTKLSVVVLSPSFRSCQDWEKYGCTIAKKDTIRDEIAKLKKKENTPPLVIVNRYDGIDLPDRACRILIFDSKPYTQSLVDRYWEECRKNSDFVNKKIGQTIEQGLGRGVRGEKDYCAVLLVGADLVKFIKSKETQKYFSPQTRMQISIGIEIAKFANEELQSGETGYDVLRKTLNQLLNRDEDWKNYYSQKMSTVKEDKGEEKILEIFELERDADNAYLNQDYRKAVNILQSLIDKFQPRQEETGWYLQEMARMIYPQSKTESDKFQIFAHKKNRELLRPKGGIKIEQIPALGLKRIENLLKWLRSFDSYEELMLSVDSFLSNIRFGVNADDFEEAMHNLGCALGFSCQRPDKEWKEGPDNLWNLKDGVFLLIEDKSEVDQNRVEISKQETGQINNSCAWFDRIYSGATAKNIMIIPMKRIGRGAGFNKEVEIIRSKNLKQLVANVKCFFNEFKNLDLKDIPHNKIHESLVRHNLTVDNLLKDYSEKPVNT